MVNETEEGEPMRLHAYVLAADPHFLRESITAYYGLVERIVVSYDRSGTSWTGTPLPVEECLAVIDDLDSANKCVLAPGDYARTEVDPLENDTYQRRCALEEAGDGTDWVLQLDTDEVLGSPRAFVAALARADAVGAGGLDYPARWLYAKVGHSRYLEASRRFWGPAASFPGPVAVRAGTTLRLARQADVPLYRVDFRPWSTDPYHPRDAVVHEVIALDEGIVHYSWIRSDEDMQRKFGWSGHTAAYSAPQVLRRWRQRSQHPWRTIATNPLRRNDWYRLAELP